MNQADPAMDWIEEVLMTHTPRWVRLLAIFAQEPTFRWLKIFPLPLIRIFTDLTIKTDTHMARPQKGFRADTVMEQRTIRIYKHGRMVASKTFPAEIKKDSDYSKLV